MLLAVDVGNTDITFGLFRESELITRFRVTVKVPRSSDEYGELICAILQQKGYSPEDVNEVHLLCRRSCTLLQVASSSICIVIRW